MVGGSAGFFRRRRRHCYQKQRGVLGLQDIENILALVPRCRTVTRNRQLSEGKLLRASTRRRATARTSKGIHCHCDSKDTEDEWYVVQRMRGQRSPRLDSSVESRSYLRESWRLLLTSFGTARLKGNGRGVVSLAVTPGRRIAAEPGFRHAYHSTHKLHLTRLRKAVPIVVETQGHGSGSLSHSSGTSPSVIPEART